LEYPGDGKALAMVCLSRKDPRLSAFSCQFPPPTTPPEALPFDLLRMLLLEKENKLI
jgi:hypothetical protein